jgi:O-antigen biosynthesis protein
MGSGPTVTRPAVSPSPPSVSSGRVRVDGKQFAVDDERFTFRGVTYGTFRPRPDGARYPDPRRAAADLVAMASAGFTVVRTYTEPPPDVLDAAGDAGLRVLAGVFYPDWRYLLGSSRRECRRVARDAAGELRAATRRLAGDDRVLAVCLGNEVPADVIRWYGTNAIAEVIREQVELVHEEDPGRLVTYANYPTAEYLALPDLDFLTFNVFLERAADLRAYLTRLHPLASDRPLVLGEVGLHVDDDPGAQDRQARFVDEQLRTALERGVAGTCLYSWTDEWWVGGAPVEGWQFGLTTTDRVPRPALDVAASWNRRTVADLTDDWPSISVVVCAYNEEDTLDECLRHTCALDYPDLEVIVVDDGSTDRTAEIARAHPRARLVTIEHSGLSVARNAGHRAARGEVVAYLDADAYPSPEWPYYLALGFDRRDVGGVGGPNVAPPGDPLGAHVVATSPGGPVHVLLTDDRAEHVPGCNMAFWRHVLDDVGGFDPIYMAAGDDVDLCWKVLDRRWSIGFHPAALVWHHRRSGLRRYLRQQRGYGHAEALVEARHPDRFSRVGTARWRGRIYDSLIPRIGRARVYRGPFGTAAYQSIYEGGGHGLDLAHQVGVPMAAATLVTAPLAAANPALGLPALLALIVLAALGTLDALRASPPRWLREGRGAFRAQVAVHHLLQPIVRAWGRYRGAPLARRDLPEVSPLPGPAQCLADGTIVLPEDRPRDELVTAAIGLLRRHGLRVTAPNGWEDHDAGLGLGRLVRGELLSSSHPVGFVQLRVRTSPRWARIALLAGAAAAAGLAGWVAAMMLIVAGALGDVARAFWTTRTALHALVTAAQHPQVAPPEPRLLSLATRRAPTGDEQLDLGDPAGLDDQAGDGPGRVLQPAGKPAPPAADDPGPGSAPDPRVPQVSALSTFSR